MTDVFASGDVVRLSDSAIKAGIGSKAHRNRRGVVKGFSRDGGVWLVWEGQSQKTLRCYHPDFLIFLGDQAP